MRHKNRLKRRLATAVRHGDLPAVTALLVRGADVSESVPGRGSALGKTMLMLAVATGSLALIRLLLEHGAVVNAFAGLQQRTALMMAVEKGDDNIVQVLLEHGASVNASDLDGWTALLLAVLEGHRAIIELLLAADADVNARLSRRYRVVTSLGLASAALTHSRNELRYLEGEPGKRLTAERRREKQWEVIVRILRQAGARE